MNDKEQKTADVILGKIQIAEADKIVGLATAYQLLTQGVLNRKNAERTDK